MTALEWTNPKEWFDALQGIHIVLVVAILLLSIVYIYAFWKVTGWGRITKYGFIPKKLLKIVKVSGILFGLLVVFYLFYNLTEIEASRWVEISLLVGLVGVTILYAISAVRQADASMKMAEEMKDARYDALRPIIDIVEQTVEPREMATRAYNAREGIFPKKLSCLIRNIGVGPAIEVYSFIVDASGETCRWDYGSIPVAIGEEEMGYRREMPLSLRQRGEHKALVVRYKDVYGNLFESSREVTFNKEKSACSIGPLKIRKIAEEEELPR